VASSRLKTLLDAVGKGLPSVAKKHGN
jgi:hypothetical protein